MDFGIPNFFFFTVTERLLEMKKVNLWPIKLSSAMHKNLSRVGDDNGGII